MKRKNTLVCALFALVVGMFTLGACKTAPQSADDTALTYDKVDVERMALETSFSREEIAKAFGVSLPPATTKDAQPKTFGDARQMYWDAPIGSPEQTVALAKMKEFATTAGEWAIVTRKLPDGSPERVAALAKAIALIKDFDEARQMYLDTPTDSPEQAVALAKMKEFAATVDEWMIVARRLPAGSPEREAAFARALALVKTFDEAQFAYDMSATTPIGSPERVAALAKMRELAQTAREWTRVARRLPDDSPEREEIIRRLAASYKK